MLHKGPGDLEKWSNRSGMKHKGKKKRATQLGTLCCKLINSMEERTGPENGGIQPEFRMIGLLACSIWKRISVSDGEEQQEREV